MKKPQKEHVYMRKLKNIMLMLAAFVLATSCIKEDYDDCDNVTIYFQYLADGNTDVLYRYMSKVDLYVFDEGGHLLGSRQYNQDELSNFSAKPSFKLPAGGRYKVVAVGNAYDDTEVVNLTATDFSDIYIQSPNWGDATPDVVTCHDHNYMGQKEFFVPGGEGVMYRDTVTLYSSHVNVSVEVHGLPAPTRANEGIYQLSFENSNAQTSFNNEVNSDEKGTIYPDLVWDAAANCYRTNNLALFRMDTEGTLSSDLCCHELVLTDTTTGEELIRGSIYNYLQRYDDEIDVTQQEANLPISINFYGVNAVIELPSWVIVGGKPDWN